MKRLAFSLQHNTASVVRSLQRLLSDPICYKPLGQGEYIWLTGLMAYPGHDETVIEIAASQGRSQTDGYFLPAAGAVPLGPAAILVKIKEYHTYIDVAADCCHPHPAVAECFYQLFSHLLGQSREELAAQTIEVELEPVDWLAEPNEIGEDAPFPKWFPKKRDTLLRWDKAYGIMCTLDKDWEDGYWERLDKDREKPPRDEYRRELARDGITYSPKRVTQIKKAGKRGWIKLRLKTLETDSQR
jgi:hypothetical protein